MLASGGADGTIQIWRVRDGARLQTWKGRAGWVMAVAFSPDGATLASGSEDKTVRLWRVADGHCWRTLAESERWDPVPGSTGHKVSAAPSEDEDEEGRSDNERLVDEGIAGAELDQMDQATRAAAKQDKEGH